MNRRNSMNNDELLTPIAAFYQHAKAQPNRVVFRQPINGELIEYSFADVTGINQSRSALIVLGDDHIAELRDIRT